MASCGYLWWLKRNDSSWRPIETKSQLIEDAYHGSSSKYKYKEGFICFDSFHFLSKNGSVRGIVRRERQISNDDEKTTILNISCEKKEENRFEFTITSQNQIDCTDLVTYVSYSNLKERNNINTISILKYPFHYSFSAKNNEKFINIRINFTIKQAPISLEVPLKSDTIMLQRDNFPQAKRYLDHQFEEYSASNLQNIIKSVNDLSKQRCKEIYDEITKLCSKGSPGMLLSTGKIIFFFSRINNLNFN